MTSSQSLTSKDLQSEYSKWHSIPLELLGDICKYLEPKDIARMKPVCKDWCSTTPIVVVADHPMWFSISNDRILFGSPVKQTMFSVKHRYSLPSIRFVSAVENLVTLVGGKTSIWVLDPAVSSLEKLPDLQDDVDQVQQAISWIVAGDLFSTFAIGGYAEEVTISLYWKLTGWTSRRYSCQQPFFPAGSSAPVRKDDLIYCLDASCLVGVFDLDSLVWRVLHPNISWPLYVYQSCHLMSAPDGVNALIINKTHMHPPMLLRLDLERTTWEQERSLGSKAVFTGGPTSYIVQETIESMADRIYLPSSMGSYDICEAKILISEGRTLFLVENALKPTLNMTWFLLDDANLIRVRSGYPSRKRKRDCFLGSQFLPYGTWIDFKVTHDSYLLACPCGPSGRPNHQRVLNNASDQGEACCGSSDCLSAGSGD